MKCKYCGQDLVEGTHTCMYCGKSMVDKPVIKNQVSKEESKILKIKEVLAKIIAAYSVAFGFLGILGVYGITENLLVSYILIVSIIVMGPLVWHYTNKKKLNELPFMVITFLIFIIYDVMSFALLSDPDLINYFLVFQGMLALPILLSIIYFIYASKYKAYYEKQRK